MEQQWTHQSDNARLPGIITVPPVCVHVFVGPAFALGSYLLRFGTTGPPWRLYISVEHITCSEGI